MREVVIVDSVRTGLAKSFRGKFNQTRPDDMAAHCVNALLTRTDIDPAGIDDVIFGCLDNIGAQAGDIANRADVVRMLDKLIRYYRQHEPSSPLPLLLERARRLVPKNFMEIMEDLAPDGVAQINVFKGPDGATQDE